MDESELSDAKSQSNNETSGVHRKLRKESPQDHPGCDITMGYQKDSPGIHGRDRPGSEKSSHRQMRLFPREHGATAIWFASLLLAFGELREPPRTPSAVVFLVASVLVLVLIGRLTSGSRVIVRLERNRTLLPVLSGLLTLIVPLGQIIMVGQLSLPVLAAWLIFLTYCSSGAVYTRDLVRSVLKEASPTWTSFNLSAVFIVSEVVILNVVHWLSIATVAIVVPLIIYRVVVLSLIQRKGYSRIERIRGVGFAQAGNLIAAIIILALVAKL
jgi:hypothetical protein